MKHPNILILATLISTVGLVLSVNAEASGRVRAHAVGSNAEGGRTAATLSAAQGRNGGAYLHGRTTQTDGTGNVSTSGGTVFRGRNGATGARAGTTSRSADGSINHQGGFTATGAAGGHIQSEDNVTRNADGINSNRSTTVTGANGTTYQGTTSYNRDSGFTHSGSCTDASGNAVSCR